MKALCLAASTVILLAASQLTSAPPPLELEGAGEAMQARLGSSFADMSAGSLTARTIDERTPAVAPSEASAAQPSGRIHQARPEHAAPARTLETRAVETTRQTQHLRPSQDASPSNSQTLAPVQPSAVVATVSGGTATSVHAVPLRSAPVSVTPSVTALAPTTPTVAPPQTLDALEPQTAAPATAKRPVQRDPVKAAAVVAARPAPKAPKPRATPAPPPPRAGNAKRNNTQGAETGSQTAKARTQGTTRKKARQAGNAAASNYPGLVERRIARLPRPRVNSRGTAVISFSVASSGGLARATVARSSGSKQLDQAALRLVRQAAPFPRPPEGAQRRYSIRIKGR